MILFMLSSLFPSKINKLLIRLVRPSCRGNQLSLPPQSALQRWLSLGVQYFPLIPEVVLPPSNVQQSSSSHHLSVSNIFPFYRKERLNIMELKARLNEKHFSNQIHSGSLSSPCRSTECAFEVLTVDHQVRRTALSSEDFLQAQQVPGFQKNQHEAIRCWFAVALKIHLVIMVSPFWLLYLL